MMQENLKLEILNQVDNPIVLQKMSVERLEQVARELRKVIISTIANNGGHLAPSLGTVDLTVALYSVFDPFVDRIIWDVGHQSYSHKILTGRLNKFHTIRKKGGITGFPRRSESSCDAFGVGHASTSISAAFGIAAARDIQKKSYSVVAIIGDGALTGGEAFEGLNNAGAAKKNMIVILNDNEMAIAKNVGAMSSYLSRMQIDPQYHQVKKDVEEIIKKIPRFGEQVWKTAGIIKDGVKQAITPGGLFEEIGFNYIGPIDGHNIAEMKQAFTQAVQMEGPILIHVRTIKGRGFLPAEIHPESFHGVGVFNPITGEIKKSTDNTPTYTEVFSKTLVELAEKNDSIVAITAAMPAGTGTKLFGTKFPERYFDVGIAEEHAVTMAAGMSAAGLHPVVALYSTFAQRAYDQILHDVCLQNLPFTLCLDRAGLVGADGATHHGVFDYSYLRHIPNMTIMAPKNEDELRNMLYTAVNTNSPVAIRYPRGKALGVELSEEMSMLNIGEGEIIRQLGNNVLILAVGSMVANAMETAEILAGRGVYSTVVNMRFIKPLDTDKIDALASQASLVVTMEENVLAGGFGSAVLEYMSEVAIDKPAMLFGIIDEFIEQGTILEQYEICGLLPEQMSDKIIERLEERASKNG